MKTKQQILNRMALYRVRDDGIGSWLTDGTRDTVFERLGKIDNEPLPAVQFNQLLVLANEAPVSDGFFRYYWLDIPPEHPYLVRDLPDFQITWEGAGAIQSLDHLAWGLHRLYVDGLLYFGNIRTAFRTLREFSFDELRTFFSAKRFDTDSIKRRGPPLPLTLIDDDKRYLISEVACKSYGENPRVTSDLRSALTNAYAAHAATGAQATTVRSLLENHLSSDFLGSKKRLIFSASEILDQPVASLEDIERHYDRVASRFDDARREALANTEYYLSMLTDLDVYVATSMGEPEHFQKMARTCDQVFSAPRLRDMNLRYFDPTLSAANGHEDKGLIECLMVKCAKALLYCAGSQASYGKDAEAAMALSLGHPVIFYCEDNTHHFKEVHPLARLIHFETGVAVGAMVTDKLADVVELLSRIFENRMVYILDRSRSGSLRLKEAVTDSVVRLQTSDKLLTEAFWNHYHQDRDRRPVRTMAVAEESITPRRSADPDARGPHLQRRLNLTDTSSLLPLAARGSAPGPISSHPRTGPVPTRPVTGPTDAFPMSAAEVFDGVSRIKRSQPTGGKRYAILSTWLESERLPITEGLKLLRFVEATLDAHGARPNYVYTASELTQWYGEMCNGEVVGSWK